MNRRSALLAILTTPLGGYAQNNSTTSIGAATWRISRIVMDMADKDGDGITELQVNYKGKTIKVSAAEIWEALAAQAASK